MAVLHPLCEAFPPIEGKAFEELVADIRAHGLLQPIVTLDGAVLDGQNRLRACEAAGVAPVFTEFAGADPIAFVKSVNQHRRHLEKGQRAMIESRLDLAAGRMAGPGGSGSNQHARAEESDNGYQVPAAQRAEAAGVSVPTQRMADKVAKADPKLAAEVAAGHVKLTEAVEKVTGKKRKPAAKKQAEPSTATEQAAAVPAAAKAPSVTKVTKEVEALRVQVADLTELLALARENAQYLAEEVKDLQAQLDGKGDVRFAALQADLKAMRISRDVAMRERVELVREVKSLQRKLGIAQ